ncbi:hypothetical protein [Cupriavidus gilardii]|nr:hypothetical protein [Cupriavidus gilardii]
MVEALVDAFVDAFVDASGRCTPDGGRDGCARSEGSNACAGSY